LTNRESEKQQGKERDIAEGNDSRARKLKTLPAGLDEKGREENTKTCRNRKKAKHTECAQRFWQVRNFAKKKKKKTKHKKRI